MYIIYSGIVTAKLTTIATRNNWISSSQKGFLPGIAGIHALGSISHATLFNMFDTLPIPHHIIYMQKDIYSNNCYEYQDFTVSPTTRVRQGDGLSTIEESDIWVISKALQLLSSSDSVIADIANKQLSKTISSALGESNIALTDILSSRQPKGLF